MAEVARTEVTRAEREQRTGERRPVGPVRQGVVIGGDLDGAASPLEPRSTAREESDRRSEGRQQDQSGRRVRQLVVAFVEDHGAQ
ncbi:MAG: hypothetical protein ACYDCI_15265, partial [Candidatus Limnocylindrales bacterium]